MIGRKTLGEIRTELEAALTRGAALRSARGEVPESLRRFLGRESPSAARAASDEVRGRTETAGPTPTIPAPRHAKRGGSKAGTGRRA